MVPSYRASIGEPLYIPHKTQGPILQNPVKKVRDHILVTSLGAYGL